MLNDRQVERYSRQLLLDDFTEDAQEKLLAARVLIVGAGGLGSPAAEYLAGAGIGTLGILDADRVDLSNLHRQTLHTVLDLGRLKADSAEEKMRLRNPEININGYPVRLTAKNAEAIMQDYDFVIDGTDNFGSKFLIADACHILGKPYSHAGVVRYQGQAITVIPGQSTCYRCIFNAPPPAGVAGSCAQSGILGPVAGMMGAIQAAEAIKFILGTGDLLTDRLLSMDIKTMKFRVLPRQRNPDCPLCGREPSITSIQDAAMDESCPTTSTCCGQGNKCCQQQGVL